MGNSTDAILKTLIYSDIFDYPLTKNELWLYLVSNKTINKQNIDEELNKLLKKKIKFTQGFYTFSDRTSLIKTRIKRKKTSRKKFLLAQKVAKKLAWIPTISFLGLSGSLAMENAGEKDDIDFFIINKTNTIWLTRLLILLTLQLLGVRRKRDDKSFVDNICVNMFMDERQLKFSKDRQNIYTAHEIVQLLPIITKNNTYQKFLTSNLWVKKFLPNALGSIKNKEVGIMNDELRIKGQKSDRNNIHNSLFLILNSFLEFLAKKAQLWYMKDHKTCETVTDLMFAFHKKDHQISVLDEFNKRLKLYGL